MAAVIFRSPPIACLSQNHLKLLDRPSQACVNNSFRSGDSTPINLRYERPVSQTQTQTHLSARGHKARNITSKAYQTDTQQTSSSATRTKESNGWAWVLGGLTLTSGTSAPALYIGSHWNEVGNFSDCPKLALLPSSMLRPMLLAVSDKRRYICRLLRWLQHSARLE